MMACLLLVISYGLLLAWYGWGFHRYRHSIVPFSNPDSKGLSIVISVRNPSKELDELIKSIHVQLASYLSYEVIVVDDFSDGEYSSQGAKVLHVREKIPNASSSKNNKKEAIALGVEHAHYDMIQCLDADVDLHPGWGQALCEIIKHHEVRFLAGIHRYQNSEDFFGQFLQLEQDVLSAIAIGSLFHGFPTMCNGANMLFRKSAFQQVGGYDGLYGIAGGDDMFLYHRIYELFPNSVRYTTDITYSVSSSAPKTVSALSAQRSRWLGKSFHYENKWILPQLALISLGNVAAVMSLLWGVMVIFLLKGVVDLVFIFAIRRFFVWQFSFYKILGFILFYPFYTLWIVIVSIRGAQKSNYIQAPSV